MATYLPRLSFRSRSRLAPVLSKWTRPGPFSPLQVVVAPSSRAGCPATSVPRRSCHGCAWTPGSADGSHRGASSLWACGANGVLPGPPGSTSRAWSPREAWVASYRTVAGSLRCPCGTGEPCGRPVVACRRSARPRGQRGIGLWPVGVALAGGSLRFALCADVAAPEAAVAPGTLRVAWHLPRLHAPEPRTGAPVQTSVRCFSGETRTGRSNVAAPVGAGG